jgi:predicted nucleotidyltransferase
VLRSEALDQIVGVLGEPNLERAHGEVVPDAVEDDVSPGALERDEAREAIDELVPRAEAAFVMDVGAVEDEKHCDAGLLVAPPAGDHLGVLRLGLGRPEGEEGKAVWACLERADRVLADADRVPLPDVPYLIVQLHVPASFDHDVDLFLLLVVVAVREPCVRSQPLVAETERAGPKRVARETRLDVRSEPELLGRIIHIPFQVLDREIAHALRMTGMDAEHAYLTEVATRLRRVLGGNLVGVYVGGSYALGGYVPGRSDLDVAAVVRERLSREAVDEVVAAVRHEALPCPARKLELVVYTQYAARNPSPEADFELNLNTGADEPFRLDTKPQPGESHWFAIDRSILAANGVALYGPPARAVFKAPTREDLIPLLAGVLRWYRDHGPHGVDAALNAGRALCFAREGVWVPKTAAAPYSLDEAIAELEALSRGAAAPLRKGTRPRPRSR